MSTTSQKKPQYVCANCGKETKPTVKYSSYGSELVFCSEICLTEYLFCDGGDDSFAENSVIRRINNVSK